MAEVLIRSLKITGTAEDRDGQWYQIQDSKQEEQIIRRYSDFCELHKQLRGKFPESSLPRLPPRSFSISLFGGPDAKFLESRLVSLNEYLSFLSNSESLLTCPDVEAFLHPRIGEKPQTSSPTTTSLVMNTSKWVPKLTLAERMPKTPKNYPQIETNSGEIDTIVLEEESALVSLRKIRDNLQIAKNTEEVLAILENARAKRIQIKTTLERDSNALNEARALILSNEKESKDEDYQEKEAMRWLRLCQTISDQGIAFVNALNDLEDKTLAELINGTNNEAKSDFSSNSNHLKAQSSVLADWYSRQVEKLITESLSDDTQIRERAIETLKTIADSIMKDSEACLQRQENGCAERMRSAAQSAKQAISAAKHNVCSGEPDQKARNLETKLYALIALAENKDEVGSSLEKAKKFHEKILDLMKEMHSTRIELEHLIENNAEAKRAVTAVDELQQNLAEFEASWSRANGIEKPNGVIESNLRGNVVELKQKLHEQSQQDMFQL